MYCCCLILSGLSTASKRDDMTGGPYFAYPPANISGPSLKIAYGPLDSGLTRFNTRTTTWIPKDVRGLAFIPDNETFLAHLRNFQPYLLFSR